MSVESLYDVLPGRHIGWVYAIEVPLEYPDRWMQLCVVQGLQELNAVLATLAGVPNHEVWPIRIQRLPIRGV
jgi:hypothetical protein